MSDRKLTTPLNADDLGSALRDLPLLSPAPGGWQVLQQSLQAQGLIAPAVPVRRHRWISVAAAAVLGFAAVLATRVTLPPTDVATPLATTPIQPNHSRADELSALRGESRRLEGWLRTVERGATPLDGRGLMAAAELEDMIGLIDLQLTTSNDSGDETRALWRSRVELLRDLAAVRTTYSLADNSIAANGNAAMPDTWTTL